MNLEAVQWLSFRAALERGVGIPLGQYKEAQMKRRLASLMERRGYSSWAEFEQGIIGNSTLLADVHDTLTINVSEFFRQPDRFDDLRNVHIPNLLKVRERLRFWSAGCSIGCEPYSLAMMLDEMDAASAHTILGTDIDLRSLRQSRDGSGYSSAEVRGVPPALCAKYLTRAGETYAVNDALKRRLSFRRHDLLSDPYPNGVDVILCRNVVIYLTDEAKQHIYSGFAKALRPGGLLFVGGSEMIMKPQQIGFRSTGLGMYQRAA